MSFISYFSRHQIPFKLPSKWTVRMDAHFIGGGRHFGTWEVADIGLMIVFRRQGKVVRSKIVLLQSKKLYAGPLKYQEENPYIRRFGLGRLLVTEDEHAELIEPKILAFKQTSKYQAFKKEDEQQQAMESFEKRFGTKMHYMFYNPLAIPHSIKMPLEHYPGMRTNEIGCRIVPKDALDSALSDKRNGYSTSYKDLRDNLTGDFSSSNATGGWRLESFVGDLMLDCKEGLIDDTPNFQHMVGLMQQKQRPMSSALSITFDIPS